MKKCRARPLSLLLLFFLALFVWMPLAMLLTGTVTPTAEIHARLSGVLGAADTLTSWRVLPERFTLKHIVELLLDTPAFYRVFWNSCAQVFPGVAGQILVGAPAAWALAFAA